MLQQGLNVADAAYFIGEDAPKMTGIVDPALPTGYQFDYMNAEVIEKYMDVKDGKITLPHGTQYRILVLPKLETMRPELLAKIKELIEKGAVVMGPAPSRSPSLQNQPAADQQVKAMAAEIWGDVDGVNVKSRKLGKGMILNGMTMEEAFATIDCIPDLNIPEGAPVHYGHRTLDNAEIYFVSNQSDETIVVTPEFRVTGNAARTVGPDHRRDTQTARLRAETGRYGRSARKWLRTKACSSCSRTKRVPLRRPTWQPTSRFRPRSPI